MCILSRLDLSIFFIICDTYLTIFFIICDTYLINIINICDTLLVMIMVKISMQATPKNEENQEKEKGDTS